MESDKNGPARQENDIAEKESDIRYWTRVVCPSVRSLLHAAGSYTAEDIEAQMRTLREVVLPDLGPRPSRAPGPSYLFQGGCPFQLSINTTSKANAVRYVWEVLGERGHTSDDPLAMQTTRDTVSRLSAKFGLSTKWSDVLLSALELTTKEAQKAVEKMPEWILEHLEKGAVVPRIKNLPFGFVAFDLKESDVSIKLYITLKAREIFTGKSAADVIFDSLRNFTPAFKPEAIDMIQNFLSGLSEKMPLEVIAIDCVDEAHLSEARVKLYCHSTSNSFNTVKKWLTIGGKVKDENTLKGLQILRSMWHLFIQKPEGIPDDELETPVNLENALKHRMYFSFELKPGQDIPQVKTYLPIWRYAPSDEQAIDNFEAAFRQCHHPWGEDGTYGRIFRNALCAPPIHGDLAYIYCEKRGVYQTIYVTPPLLEED
uniref:Indole diterpene prenyltransferase idtF n=1 Tax=Claviceps paspali TaxID=40601 RepID=IDTF_CLAPA|nr:RecName: Full=Indole diterpene prenyltransferase idtF; AltName: Full=Indole-diterpene biosynthesis cluster protein F [Claviceps paspali]AFO85419.1 aromatic prenyl transferase [Claviceps paspali]